MAALPWQQGLQQEVEIPLELQENLQTVLYLFLLSLTPLHNTDASQHIPTRSGIFDDNVDLRKQENERKNPHN